MFKKLSTAPSDSKVNFLPPAGVPARLYEFWNKTQKRRLDDDDDYDRDDDDDGDDDDADDDDDAIRR